MSCAVRAFNSIEQQGRQLNNRLCSRLDYKHTQLRKPISMNTIFAPADGIRTDLFRAINYETRPGKNGPVQGIQFPRRFVLRWMFEVTWKHISAGLVAANPYRLHSTEELFDDAELWAKYDADMHRVFGRCLAYFTNDDNRMLPLSCVNPHQNNRLYQKIDRRAFTVNCDAYAQPLAANFNPQFFQGNLPCQF